jgi:Sortase domain
LWKTAEGTALADAKWRRIAGLRVVMCWPDSAVTSAPPRPSPGAARARIAGFAGALLLLGGAVTIAVAAVSQQHAPQPAAGAAGAVGPAAANGPSVRRSLPISVEIPAIGVRSKLLRLGVNADGTMQVPSLTTSADEAAWYKYSATPGQIGASVIEGHVDSHHGPAVFFRLGALHRGDIIDVTLADGVTAIFRVTGVREYTKSKFPARMIYGAADYAALRLITCGGSFDPATGHYLSSTVVFASLISHRAASRPLNAA